MTLFPGRDCRIIVLFKAFQREGNFVFVRIGVTAAMAIAASAFILGGQPTAKADGCASKQPTWGFQCLASASNVSYASCKKDAPLWNDRAQCVQRDDGSGRYDVWVPSN
ncbi:hypothetical protein [Nocardia niwae]|uniref:Uncharacterized protein n=1 Tax=Nocardia niwae TaxID=626084 RepID=A0ABV2XHF7_9NOCA